VLEEQLFNDISNHEWRMGVQDTRYWSVDTRGGYTISSGYKILNQEANAHNWKHFEVLWSTKGAPSTLVCCWRVIIHRLPTRMNLSRKGVAIGNQICPMCLED